MRAVEAGNREMVEVLLKGQLQCNINLQEHVSYSIDLKAIIPLSVSARGSFRIFILGEGGARILL